MRSLRISILWIIGIILWVFGLTIGLGWLQFGYLDWKTIGTMGLIMVPVLGVAIGVLVWTHVHEAAEEAALNAKNAPATQAEIKLAAAPTEGQPAPAPVTRQIHSHS